MEQARKQVLQDLSFAKEETVRVMPIVRKSDWLPENHDGEFLNQGAKLDIVVPEDVSREQLVDPLAHLKPAQKAQLAKKLGLKEAEDLNPLKPGKENYWKNRQVRLKREGLILKTTEPYDYVRMCILLSDFERIAPTWNNRNDKFTYRFAIVREGDQSKEESHAIDEKSKAFEKFNDIKDSVDALDSVLWLRYYEKSGYKKPPVQPSHDAARIEVGKMVNDTPGVFLDVVDKENYETKVLVHKGLKYDVLVREGQQIRFKSNAKAIGMFDEVVSYLDLDKNAEDKRKLQDLIEQAEKVTDDRK